ncbi:MAG: hypothetical protein LBV52_03265 [Spirochaetaceae bacterium]|jgi:uncharacterized protein YPO0396|nr:hypothetical protein [Spirochaetaceae bacterium]
MITLECVRLVCWHYFEDVLIKIGNRCLFAGDNGSGKSTIIDAIQYAMAADLRKARFNAAAGDKKGGRDLLGYVRCKLGSDNTEYLRGDTVSHVMLEFSAGNTGFSVGVCIEAFTDGKLSEHFWLAENTSLENVSVNDINSLPFSFRMFRDAFTAAKISFFDSKRNYMREFTAKLGVWRRMSEYNPYLEAFTRSVSFTPMVSVDKFVCDYILEDRPVDISAMKMNLESYKEAEREANAAVKRIAELKKICAKAEEWRALNLQIVRQEYLKLFVELKIAQEEKDNLDKKIAELKAKQIELESEIKATEKIRLEWEGEKQETESALAANDQHQLYRRLEEKSARLKFEIDELQQKVSAYNLLCSQLEALLNRKLSKTINDDIQIVEKNELESRAAKEDAARKKTELSDLLQDAMLELSDLEKGTPRYPEAPVLLKKALRDAGIEAHFLADTSEVIDEDWADAAEGWLNTLRFAVLTNPDEFQKSLEIYNKLPRSVGGAFLPNLAKMRGAKVKDGTLAQLIKTDSPYSKIYIDYILGDVVCADIKTIKDYNKAVTKECMSYSNYTASRIREDVYKRHYLGQRARRERKDFLVAEIARLRNEKDKIAAFEKQQEQQEEIFRRAYRSLVELSHLEPALAVFEKTNTEYQRTKTELDAIDTSGFEELQNKRKQLAERIREADGRITNLHISVGGTKQALDDANSKCDPCEEKHRLSESLLAEFSKTHSTEIAECEVYTAERIKGNNFKSIAANYESSVRSTVTRKEKCEKEYHLLVQVYDRDFNALLSFEPDESNEAGKILLRLETSELPEYREKIAKARHDAEREFKDHFISRLNEFIEDARESFREINDTLKTLRFGRDQYSFTLTERSERRGQIEIVRKAAEIPQFEDGDSLFSQFTDPAELKAVQTLFERILSANLDSPELRNICDYRTYFNYDIKIRDCEAIDDATGLPVVLSLSKVLREKSGGEAQTPYYVAIAACFFRFYKNHPEDTVRLVMFDEAFNRMDDERIGKILHFFRELNLQLISAVPTEKIEAMLPFMDRTNLVIRHGYSAFVRDFFNKNPELDQTADNL